MDPNSCFIDLLHYLESKQFYRIHLHKEKLDSLGVNEDGEKQVVWTIKV